MAEGIPPVATGGIPGMCGVFTFNAHRVRPIETEALAST